MQVNVSDSGNALTERSSRTSRSVSRHPTLLMSHIDLTLDREIQSSRESNLNVAQTRRSTISDNGVQSFNVTPSSTPRIKTCSGKNMGLHLAFRKRCAIHRQGSSANNLKVKSDGSKVQNSNVQAFVFEDIQNSIGRMQNSPVQRPSTTGTLQSPRARLTSRLSSSGMDRESSPRSNISYDRMRAEQSPDETNPRSPPPSNERWEVTKLSGV
jgi:hypothetical protein